LKIIGLAGGSGSGKTTVAELFSKNGFAYIDTDKVYHGLTSHPSPCLDDLVHEFGREILNPDCSLNREHLSEIVFQPEASEKREKLNKIAHSHVISETFAIISSLDESEFFAVLIDAPLLFESGLDKSCDKVISVVADEKIRISRIVARDGITEERALKRIKSQLSDEFLRKNSDYIIVNDGNLYDLKKQVDMLSEQIKNL